MTYHDPIRDLLYGVPLYYRIEKRAGGDALIVSYRETEGTARRICYEMPPIGGKKIQAQLREIIPNLSDGKGLLQALPVKIQERLLQEWIGLDTKEGRDRRRNTPGLTLGILLAADRDRLLYNTASKRKDATIRDDQRALERIQDLYGNCPWKEVTPQTCSPWLASQTERAQKDCKRMMLSFERLQLQAGVLECLTWDDYVPKTIRRKGKSRKRLVGSQIEPVVLTDGQCASILQRIKARIDNRTATGVDMTILLMLTAGLDLKHISVLRLSDFYFLDDFRNRLVVSVTHTVIKASNNFLRCEIEDPYEQRIVPVPMMAAKCYRGLMDREPCADRWLVPDPSNRGRRLSPKKLRGLIEIAVSDVQILRITDVKGIKMPAVVDMLRPTGLCELRKAGLEDEELRALCGKRPRLVSGRHYYDRRNEVALNKLGAIQDRWLQRICPTEAVERTKGGVLAAKDSLVGWVAQNPGQCTQILIEIYMPPIPREQIPEGGIMLELSATHGLTGTIIKEVKSEED